MRTMTLSLAAALCLGICVDAKPQTASTGATVSKAEREKRGLPLDAVITMPLMIFAPEPEFPKKYGKHPGIYDVIVHLQVDKSGNPQNVTVPQKVGFGFDECAIAAARQYRFKPATQDGVPIQWEMDAEINFQAF